MGAERTEILVLGASFAGVEVVYQLLQAFDGRPPAITVVDRQTEHGYLPLVQERMCGVTDADASRLNTRAFIESVPDATFVQDEVVSFDPETKAVTLSSGRTITARFVVVALGSAFDAPVGVDGSERILTYKRQDDFEASTAALAERLAAGDGVQLVVVGGGISGCELAGELAQLRRTRPQGWSAPEVRLVSSAPALAGSLRDRVAAKAKRALERQGVTVDLGTRVVAVREGQIDLVASGARQTVSANLVFWAGGVRPAAVLAALGLPRTEAGWLAVGPTLQCFADPTMTRPDIFACGDAVRVQSGAGEWATMQRAIECIWQAGVVVRNLRTLHELPETYPEGVPPLKPHVLRREFFYGLSLGARSMVVYRGFGLDLPGINHGFRRWLMRQYLARYAPLPSARASM